jgi:osmoprotectant transport system permease protein
MNGSGEKKGSFVPSYVWRHLGMPIFLALVCLGLYLYVGTKDLDSIEQRVLNTNTVTDRVIEHLQLTAVATTSVVVLAVTAGVLLTRPALRRITPFVVNVANIGQAIPSIGLLVLFAIIWTTGFRYAVLALIAYAFLPVLRNTMVGLQQVDRSVIEAGRGMGMSKTAVLFRIELPLAIPIMLAGIRTALVLVVGTATLAAFVNAGGMGNIIDAGITLGRNTVLITGAVLTAVLALTVDWLAGIAEDVLRPRGL